MRGSLSATRLAPYILVAPFVVLFLAFGAYPIAQSLMLSTQQTFGPGHARHVGLSNFRWLLEDPVFWQALRNTALFTAGSVCVQLPLSLGMAIILNRENLRGRALYRAVLFAPSLVGVVFVGMLFSLVLEKRTGLLNRVLHGAFGFNLDFPWLFEHTMASLILASLWMWVGFNMVYFLAALQNVRKDLLEAAVIDGAGPFRRFVHVTVPAILPVASFVTLLSVIGSFQLFELPWIMITSLGAGHASRGVTLVMYLYQRGFEIGDLGYASAVGWVIAAVLVTAAAAQRLVSRRAEELE